MMQQVSETDPLSYYQIAGIHGIPHIPWGEPASPNQDSDYGYCTHASVLFATWHRPYLALIEQRISAHAVNEGRKFRGAQAGRWQAAAARVRLPYVFFFFAATLWLTLMVDTGTGLRMAPRFPPSSCGRQSP